MSAVTVVDYGAGNLLNVVRALSHCGAQVTVARQAADIAAAERVVFPGVGAFADCMQALETLGIRQALIDYMATGRLFLGVCVGMQVLFESSEEFGDHAGLGVISGRVARIPSVGAAGQAHKVPHIGWNALKEPTGVSWDATPLEPLKRVSDRSMYFVHSYSAIPARREHWLAAADYNGLSLCAAVRAGNLYGMQFHPEKSGETGLELLRHFLTMPAK